MASTTKTQFQKSLVANWHAIQYKSLTILFEREASPSEIGEAIGEPNSSNVAYHVRQLEKRGLVEEVGQRPGKRGAPEHIFKARVGTALTGEEWEALSQEQREEYSAWTLQLWSADLGEAVQGDSLDAECTRHLTRQPLHLDAQGKQDLYGKFMELYEAAWQIQAESDQRRVTSHEPSERVSALLGCFPLPPIERP